MSDTFEGLYNEFLSFVNKGDEAGARNFLVENLQKFPEEVQDKLTFAFFEEALTDEAKKDEGVVKMQKEGLEAISQIDKAKKILEEKAKIENLRSDLTK
jgi:hypothetical protein